MYVCVYMGRYNAAARVVGVRSLLALGATQNLKFATKCVTNRQRQHRAMAGSEKLRISRNEVEFAVV